MFSDLSKGLPIKSVGWRGLSEECAGGEQIADTGDYDDPLCPRCTKEAEEACGACEGCEKVYPNCPASAGSAYVDDDDYE